MPMHRKNCWEVKKCGRQSDGQNVGTLGICPASLPSKFDGTNQGKLGGRFCWAIAGTFCGGEVPGTFATKLLSCLDCGFLQQVREEEGYAFKLTHKDVEDELGQAEINTLQKTAVIAKKALVFMAKNEIPVIPENYKVWFEYHLGNNQGLERDVKESAARGTPLNKEFTENLYNRYFVDKEKERIIALVEDHAGKMLREIISCVLISVEGITEYNKKLKQYSQALTSESDAKEIKRIIKDIVMDTIKLEKSNVDLQKKLENITAETENLKKQIEQKERDLLKDPLTGLYNRRALDKKLKELYREFKKSGDIFSAIMCDLNLFKKFNDQYGHMIGDEALQIVSTTLEENTKGKDFIGRYGGDEFILLLPMTPLYSASIVAENLRKAVSEKKLKLKNTGQSLEQLSISLGVSQIHAGDTIKSVIERADASLSLAKRSNSDNTKSEKDL